MVLYFASILAMGIIFLEDAPEDEWSAELGYYLAGVALVTLILIYIGYKKGPKPRWRWGSKVRTQPEE